MAVDAPTMRACFLAEIWTHYVNNCGIYTKFYFFQLQIYNYHFQLQNNE